MYTQSHERFVKKFTRETSLPLAPPLICIIIMTTTLSPVCEGCGASEAPMLCPKCKELGLPPSFFCKQECFKASWKNHKDKHTQKPTCSLLTMTPQAMAMYQFTGGVRPGKITPKRGVPKGIARPDYADHPEGRSQTEEAERKERSVQHDAAMIEKMRRACKLGREVLNLGCAAVRPGVPTDEIDRIVHEATIERGMYPSPLNYYNFPKSVCTSVNEIICHGIPDSRELQEGDIVNVDVSCYVDGVHADLNETLFVGTPGPEAINLVHTAYECLYAGIGMVRPGTFYRDVGNAITERATKGGCSVVRTYCGHGVSDKFHCAPTVPHYAGNKAVGTMAPGHIFTIEPMINLGHWQDVTWPDKWTSATVDGKWSAQFEHTMVVTKEGVEILTGDPEGPWYQRQLKQLCIPLPS